MAPDEETTTAQAANGLPAAGGATAATDWAAVGRADGRRAIEQNLKNRNYIR